MAEVATEGLGRRLIVRIDAFLERMITSVNPYHPSKLRESDLKSGSIEDGPVRRAAIWLIVGAIALFGIWASVAPLDDAATLQSHVIVAGYRKAVQHPKGGVVLRVFVSEGSHVTQGQTLIKINPLDTDANAANIEQQYIDTLVTESRERAELLDRPIAWDPELATLTPSRVAEAKAIQLELYQNRRAAYQEQLNGMQAQIAGQTAATVAARVQVDTLAQEMKNAQDLQKQGFLPTAQLNTAIRQHADQKAQLENAQSVIGKTQSDMAGIKSKYQSDLAKDLADLDKTRQSLGPQLRAARFSQSLSSIRAPVTGTVVNLKVFTEGGVVSGGDTLMEIVPDNGTLIIEAKVPPDAIDTIQVGQEADVQIPVLGSVTTPTIYGRVKAVGIDQQKATPGQTIQDGDQFYLAQVEVTPEALKVLHGQPLHPGMPATVIVRRGERTFLSYLFKPTRDNFARAFRQ